MAESMGYASRMTTGGNAVEFISHDIKEVREIVADDGIRGVRSRAYERIAQGLIQVAGSINLQPTPLEMSYILPLVTGSSTSATVLTDALADVTVVCSNATSSQTFVGRISAMHISGSSGKKIDVKLDFVGKTCTMGSGGVLSGTPDITVRPYMFYDAGSGLTVGGSAYAIDKFELTIDNKIEPTYMVGQTATDLEPTDRIVTLSVETKYTSTEAGLLTTQQTGPTIGSAITGSLALTNGSNSMTFTFASLQAITNTVVVPNKKHLRLPLNYQAYKVGSTLEVVPVLV